MTEPFLFRRTGGEDFPDRLKVMISGPPKSGKTSLVGTVPNIVVADTEPHANNLQSIAHKNVPYVTINAVSDLQRLLITLRDQSMRKKAAEGLGIPDIEAVAIDTLDSLQKLMKRERMREQRTNKFLRDDWGWLKEEMTSILSAFTALPLHVFFTVHLKTKDIGSEDNPQTIILPGLEGAIAEDIAGMVGYSLLSFRKQEIRPDGSPYTKYWLRAEGDETYNFLGNRAAGRLPDIIEPSFSAIYDAAFGGRRPAPAPAPVPVQPTVTKPAEPIEELVAQGLGHTETAPAAAPEPAPAPEPAIEPAPAAQHATADGRPAAGRPDDDEPVNAAALGFCKRVYDAAGLEFPEDTIMVLTLGRARELVKYWQAVQQDAVEGKLAGSPSDEMTSYLHAQGWLSARDQARVDGAARGNGGEVAAPEPPPGPVADPVGTIEQVMTYIGEDLARAEEVYELEVKRAKPRATLINALTTMGVQVRTPVQTIETRQVAEPAQADTPTTADRPSAEVTPTPPAAETQGTDDQQTEQRAMVALQEGLGAIPIDDTTGTPLPCEECGRAVDDEDIATLSRSRFNRRLCVKDYIAETKKSH